MQAVDGAELQHPLFPTNLISQMAL